jgi:hypothetical protein
VTLRNFHTLNVVRGMAAALLVAGLMVQAGAQDNPSETKGLPNDWTHQHVIFSNPGTMQDAIQNGTYERWLRVQTDPRFKMQQLRRQTVQLPESDQVQQMGSRAKKLKRDWSVSLGAGGVAATMYPAKYSFNINNATCTDFVVFPANSAGVAAVAASQTGTFTGNPTNGQTATIGGTEVLTASVSTFETATITLSATTVPANNSTVTIGSVTYTFKNSTPLTAPAAGACNIRSLSGTDSETQVAANLNNAINNSGGGNTTWLCGSGGTPNSAATSTRATRTLSLTATVIGTAGNFTFSQGGTTNFTTFSSTPGTDGTNTGTSFRIDNVVNDDATNLAAAITRNGGTVGVTAGSAGGMVTVTATTPGASGDSITLASTLSNFSWNSGTLTGGANGQANLVGITNLYSGTGGLCGANPTILFSYEVGTGTVETSPALSNDGTKIAYVESSILGSRFHVLKIGTTGSNGTAAISPVTPGTGNNAADTAILMNGNVQVTLSSPFVDTVQDIGYVGDNSGRLHKFTGVFNGTPAEVTTGGWPVTVSTGVLTGPTLDFNTGRIFVGDSLGVLRYVTASTGVVGATTINVGNLNGTGQNSGRALIDPPVIDSSIGMVYAFIGCALPATGTCSGGNGFGVVMQATTALASPKWIELGTGSGTNNMHIGAFDNTYYIGPIQNSHLYVCGDPSLANNPILYQVGFNASGVMTTASGTTLNLATNSGSDDATECSPLTEIYNTTTSLDWLFLSVANYCNATTGGTAGCAQNFKLPDTVSGFPGAAVVGAAESTGTSAFVIDNVSSAGQASSIYFGTLTGGNNDAIKLTQSGLN